MTNRQIGMRASPPAKATKRSEPVRRRSAAWSLTAAALAVLGAAAPLRAADPENCLSCHRYRALARLSDDGRQIRLFYVDPNYVDRGLGPHARLLCTDCHPRSEVEVIPHQVASPVNCSRTCHLAPSNMLEVRFGHDRILAELRRSVHTDKVLDESNRLLGEPLRAGQARCLLCHDEPVFRRAGRTWAEQEAPIERCNVCHTQELPKDTRYYYWHVYARSRPARSHRDLARVCALCHSEPRVREHYDLPDATASYLASFHGKAMLLGSEATAACLECHAGPLQDVHRMQSREDPSSPTNSARLPDTCRSANCHPAAGYGVSTAAVHFELAASRGVEYFIGVGFVLLIIFTFGPSVVLQALEMLQIICGRQDPAHEARRKEAERLLARPEGRRLLKRFTPHQRVQHWLLFVTFTALVITGFPIKFADRDWAAWMIGMIGNLHRARVIHHWAGAILLVGMVYHLGYVLVTAWQRKKRTGKSAYQIAVGLPMVMGWRDWKELWYLLGYLLFLRKTRPEAGRFSFEEKFEYFGVFWGCALLGVTGILMWANAWTTEHLTGRVLTIAALVHTFEALLALLHVGIIHMVGVIFSPGVFPLSPAMITGDTPADELAEAHSAMITEAGKALEAQGAKEASRG